MKIIDCKQYSPEWWSARRGVPTASRFDEIITPSTGKKSGQAKAYMAELAGDVACLNPNFFSERDAKPKSYAMAAGTANEPHARLFYEMERSAEVQQVGFVMSDCGRFGCSPDGLVGEDGGLELKCPMLKTQAQYVLGGTLPVEYRPQVHGTLIITGRPWWDFLSYSPGLPPLLVRVEPDEYTEALRQFLNEFFEEYQVVLKKLGLEYPYQTKEVSHVLGEVT
jgi:hypothetical protein